VSVSEDVLLLSPDLLKKSTRLTALFLSIFGASL